MGWHSPIIPALRRQRQADSRPARTTWSLGKGGKKLSKVRREIYSIN